MCFHFQIDFSLSRHELSQGTLSSLFFFKKKQKVKHLSTDEKRCYFLFVLIRITFRVAAPIYVVSKIGAVS